MHGDAAAAGAMRVDQGRHLAIQLRLSQGLHHDVPLPVAIAIFLPVLDRAAAADAEMPAERRDPLSAGALDREQAPAVGVTAGYGTNLDGLAFKRVRHIDVCAVDQRDAVAEMTDVIDDEMFNHGVRR